MFKLKEKYTSGVNINERLTILGANIDEKLDILKTNFKNIVYKILNSIKSKIGLGDNVKKNNSGNKKRKLNRPKKTIKTTNIFSAKNFLELIKINKEISLIDQGKIIENPFRYEKKTLSLRSQLDHIQRQTYNNFQGKIPDEIVNISRQINKIILIIEDRISEITKGIYESKMHTFWGENSYLTIKELSYINIKTKKYPEGLWNPEKIQSMEIQEYINYINENSSGRYLLHSFPEISINNGYITDQTGAGENYRQVKGDAYSSINFTTSRYIKEYQIKAFYPALQSMGGVFFPEEIILENYGFANIANDTAEWRMIGPINNINKSLHQIPLNIGICFFNTKDKSKIALMISKLPENEQPNKIIWYGEGQEYMGESEALTGFIKSLKNGNKKKKDLPHISKIIEPQWKEGEYTIFGTNVVTKKLEN